MVKFDESEEKEGFANPETGTGFASAPEDPSSRWSSGGLARAAAVRDASTALKKP